MVHRRRRTHKRHTRRRATRRYRGGAPCRGPNCPAGGKHELGPRISSEGNYTRSYRTCAKCGCTIAQTGPAA